MLTTIYVDKVPRNCTLHLLKLEKTVIHTAISGLIQENRNYLEVANIFLEQLCQLFMVNVIIASEKLILKGRECFGTGWLNWQVPPSRFSFGPSKNPENEGLFISHVGSSVRLCIKVLWAKCLCQHVNSTMIWLDPTKDVLNVVIYFP